jgi:hypothetical protein
LWQFQALQKQNSERSTGSNNSYNIFWPSVLWFQPAPNIQDEDVAEEYKLKEDVYSMLLVHGHNWNSSSLYAMLVIGWEIFMIAILYYNLLKDRVDLNLLNILITVETQVCLAQFLSVSLAIMIHKDCT